MAAVTLSQRVVEIEGNSATVAEYREAADKLANSVAFAFENPVASGLANTLVAVIDYYEGQLQQAELDHS